MAARCASLLAQARLATGELEAARAASHDALRKTRLLGDAAALALLRDQDAAIGAALEAAGRERKARDRATHLTRQSVQDVVETAASPLALADALIRLAGAHQLLGNGSDARTAALRAIPAADESGQVRERVLARLTLVEVSDVDRASVLADAHAIADAADETTLIGLVAKAAELAGMPIATVGFAGRSTEC